MISDALRRRGIQLLLVSGLALLCLLGAGLRSERLSDIWLTRDQQGALAFADRDYALAAGYFRDPQWRGMAAYRGGQYEAAADSFGRVATATGFYNRGDALLKGRDYRAAIEAFTLAVDLAPDWREARENLELARHIRTYIEDQREQSDTGDESELSADDVTFDNEDDRGRSMEITRESTLERESAEKWMRTVDTQTADFLRKRFAIELLQRDEGP